MNTHIPDAIGEIVSDTTFEHDKSMLFSSLVCFLLYEDEAVLQCPLINVLTNLVNPLANCVIIGLIHELN